MGLTIPSFGCGGGGGGGSQQVTQGSARTAVIRIVQQSRALPTLLGVVQSGLGDVTATRSAGKERTFARIALRLWNRSDNQMTRQVSDLEFVPDLNLYARTTEGTTSYRIDFFEDAAGTDDAGSIAASLTGLNTARVEFDVTDGNLPVDGTLNLTLTGTESVRTTGTVSLPSLDERLSPDLTTNTSDGATTGTLSVTGDNGTIRYTNLQVAASGVLDSDVEYRGATGTVNQNADAGGRVVLNLNVRQRYEALYNPDGSGALTFYNEGGNLEQEIAVVDDFDEL